MIVDDDKDQIFTIKQVLENSENPYQVLSAEDGMQCLALLENDQIPDLILLDIMMPGMSGWELFDQLKANPTWQKIPVIFLTARTDQVAEEVGRFLGDDYIEKPFKWEDLLQRIESALKKQPSKGTFF